MTLKSIHMLGVLFLGHVIITGVWKYSADQNARPEVVGFSQRLATITDWVFTAEGIELILLGGYGMLASAGLTVADTPLVQHGLTLFRVSGAIWVAILFPIQFIHTRMACDFENGGVISARYWALSRHWFIWGTIATVLPLINIYVMVHKS